MALILELAAGESFRIGSGTTVRVEQKSGSRIRLSIDSEYRVVREPRGAVQPTQQPPEAAQIRRPR
jgi:hypothetical protein